MGCLLDKVEDILRQSLVGDGPCWVIVSKRKSICRHCGNVERTGALLSRHDLFEMYY